MARSIESAYLKIEPMVMKMRPLHLVVALLATCTCLANTSLAVEIKNHKPMDTKLKPSQKRVSLPLSISECAQLGGTVNIDVVTGVCNSGMFCRTFDENGKRHEVCIREMR
jgi:hypothetical protein